MTGKKFFYLFLFVTAAATLFILWNGLSQPGINDLKGDFKEAALYRNENNTGPITRIYAVTLKDTLWEEMKQYGDFMPHTKYGTTRVYFFPADVPVPLELQPGEPNFKEEYNQYCLALYEKGSMGGVRFIRYPFLQN